VNLRGFGCDVGCFVSLWCVLLCVVGVVGVVGVLLVSFGVWCWS